MFKVTEVNISEININDRSRTDYGDIPKLAEDIENNTLLYPILINQDNTLLDGGRRLKAYQHLNRTTIPCRILPNLTKEDQFIIELIGNNARKDFTWSEEVKLKRKIHNILSAQNQKWGYRETSNKLNCALGGLSSDIQIARILDTFPQLADLPTKAKARDTYKKMVSQAEAINAHNNLSDEDKDRLEKMVAGSIGVDVMVPKGEGVNTNVTPPKNTVPVDVGTTIQTTNTTPSNACMEPNQQTQTSDEQKYLYKISSFKELLREIPNNIIGFAELDPPYAIDFNKTYGQTTKIKSTEKDWTVEKLYSSMEWLFKKLFVKMLDSSWVLCWTGKEHWQMMNSFAKSAGFNVQEPGVWIKQSGSSNSPKTNMVSQYEMFLLMRKGQAQFNTSSFPNVISMPTLSHTNRGHQWEKPIDLYNKFMQACGKGKSIFFSAFAGSGASMVSASLHDMTPMGCDVEQKYFYRFIELYKNRHMEV